jgi:UDP-N-acetylmuramate--alanine ligase
MNLNQIHNVYFIGTGIGMSALARYFKNIGKQVLVMINAYSFDKGDREWYCIHFEDSIDMIPKDYFIENTLVIITPAVSKTHLNGTIL